MNLRFREVGVALGGIEMLMIKKHLWVGVDQEGAGHQYDQNKFMKCSPN